MIKLLFIVNDPKYFVSHRLPIAKKAAELGYDVHVGSSMGPDVRGICDNNFTHHEIHLSRGGKNLISEIKTFFSILCLLWKVRPSILHLVTLKPVLYGGLAARISPVKSVVAAVAGLGYVFISKSRTSKILRLFIGFMYRFSLGGNNTKVIFQNADDLKLISDLAKLSPGKAVLIKGSGVDLSKYSVQSLPKIPVVTFAARYLWDKGIGDFVSAAKKLADEGLHCKFHMIGELDEQNPSSVTAAELVAWEESGVIKNLGYSNDINHIFGASSIIVLPSYREGFPKVLMEAAACARAVVTTDAPGCRDAIIPEVSGLLVPIASPDALSVAIRRLVDDIDLCEKFGLAGRVLAEDKFDIHAIVEQHIEVYASCIGDY